MPRPHPYVGRNQRYKIIISNAQPIPFAEYSHTIVLTLANGLKGTSGIDDGPRLVLVLRGRQIIERMLIFETTIYLFPVTKFTDYLPSSAYFLSIVKYL